MKKIICIILFVILSGTVFAQSEELTQESDEVVSEEETNQNEDYEANWGKYTETKELLTGLLESYEPVKVKLNGKNIDFDVPPQILKGKAVAPIRTLLNTMGVEQISWEGRGSEACWIYGNPMFLFGYSYPDKSELNFDMVVTNPYISYSFKDNEDVYSYGRLDLEPMPVIVENSLFFPVREMAELIGYTVTWDEETRTVNIDGENVKYAIKSE